MPIRHDYTAYFPHIKTIIFTPVRIVNNTYLKAILIKFPNPQLAPRILSTEKLNQISTWRPTEMYTTFQSSSSSFLRFHTIYIEKLNHLPTRRAPPRLSHII